MSPSVPHEIGPVFEDLATLKALIRIRILSTVDPPVLCKVGFVVEGLLTFPVLIRLLSIVNHKMLKKVWALAEGLPTLGTSIYMASLQSDSSHVKQGGVSC